MSFEKLKANSKEHLKKVRNITVTFVGGTALSLTVGHGLSEAAKGPSISGEETHIVQPGETYDTIANSVDGGASHTGDTSEYIQNHPENADVRADGMLSVGEELVIPTKVEDR